MFNSPTIHVHGKFILYYLHKVKHGHALYTRHTTLVLAASVTHFNMVIANVQNYDHNNIIMKMNPHAYYV